MEGSGKRAGNARAACVVRQFQPSRIERQLLAQVFELIWQASSPPAVLESPTSEAQANSSCGDSANQSSTLAKPQVVQPTPAVRRNAA